MIDARQVAVSHLRERRSTADEVDKTLPCNQTGVLVAKDSFMMYITYISVKNGNISSDAFKGTTNLVLPESDIEIENASYSLK